MANFTGTAGDDTVTGTGENDVIEVLGGNDRVAGGGGNDVINGGDGDDVLQGDGAAGNLIASRAANGTQGNAQSQQPQFSPDGSRIAFNSTSSNLTPGDANGFGDLFIRDLNTGAITLVSTSATGVQGNAGVGNALPSFSPDGTRIAFSSTATNLVAGDGNGFGDIFIKTLATGAIALVSTNAAGELGNGFSARPDFASDGNRLLFDSTSSNLVAGDTTNNQDVFLKNLATGVVTRVSASATGEESANGSSFGGVFSPDGNSVLFVSAANNLVAGDTNNLTDIFLKDLRTGAITRVSTTATGEQQTIAAPPANPGSFVGAFTPVFSPDGTKVAFESAASNLVAGDTNNQGDVFVKDLVTGVVTRVSVNAAGVQGDNASFGPRFTPDGQSIVFGSVATNLIAGDTNGLQDVFVKNLITGVVTRVATGVAGAQPNGAQFTPIVVSSTGAIAFGTAASNLLPDDANAQQDIIVVGAGLGAGDDVLSGGAGNDLIGGGAGADRIDGGDGNDFIGGEDGNDVISGGAGADILFGDAGNDLIGGGIGADSLYGGAGDDFLGGEADNDFLDGGEGRDVLFGDAGDDVLLGGAGNDSLFGQDGADRLNGQDGDDVMEGGAGNDVLSGGAGADTAVGGAGNDLIGGGLGNDVLSGGDGDDFIGGEDGADTISGGAGADVLFGDAGNDLIGGGHRRRQPVRRRRRRLHGRRGR
jgi:Tol biopolymer transport system component